VGIPHNTAIQFVFSFSITLFLFGSLRQIKLDICQLLGARKHSVSYRIIVAESEQYIVPVVVAATALVAGRVVVELTDDVGPALVSCCLTAHCIVCGVCRVL